MKKLYTLISFSLIALFGNAAIHTVAVSNFAFTPSGINAVCGDTVRWAWASGSHTTTSTSVPNGAATWSAPMNSTSITFDYVVTVAGTYNYQCNIHPSTMTGTIVVTCVSGIPSIGNNYFSAAYPNPFTSKLTIETSDADMISIYNFVGEKIKTIALPHGQTKTEIDLQNLSGGIYFYAILKEGVVVETRRVVKN